MRYLVVALFYVLIPGISAADPHHTTLYGSFIVGFQGWFMCPGDGRANGGWYHWFDQGQADTAHLHFDLVPDGSDLALDEVCKTQIATHNGSTLRLFSDQNPKTVARQFRWMHEYGIDVAALQRFVVDVEPERPVPGRAAIDRVLENVRKAAAQSNVGFYIMYDIAGADPNRWADLIIDDWERLTTAGITRDASYQHHRGHPVLCIAGIGSNDRPGTPQEVIALTSKLRTMSASHGGLTIIASTATGWRTRDADSKREPAWDQAYDSFDVISPWTVGRYSDTESYQHFVQTSLRPDMAEATRRGLDYLPIIFPGASTHNLTREEQRGERPPNSIPREGGRFLWMQAVTAKKEGARMLYGAMFDEVDEGTALFKLAPDHSEAPNDGTTITLDQDGEHLPADWYLRLSGSISGMLKDKSTANLEMPIR